MTARVARGSAVAGLAGCGVESLVEVSSRARDDVVVCRGRVATRGGAVHPAAASAAGARAQVDYAWVARTPRTARRSCGLLCA